MNSNWDVHDSALERIYCWVFSECVVESRGEYQVKILRLRDSNWLRGMVAEAICTQLRPVHRFELRNRLMIPGISIY